MQLYVRIKCKFLISLTQMRATYMCPWLTDLCLSKLKLITPAFKLRPCTSWTLRIHDNISGNWLQRMTGDDILNLFLYIDAFSLFFGTHLLFLAIMSFPLIRFCPADMSSKVYPLSHKKRFKLFNTISKYMWRSCLSSECPCKKPATLQEMSFPTSNSQEFCFGRCF